MTLATPRGLAAAALVTLALPGTTQAADQVSWDLALFGSPAFRVAGEALAEYVNENSDGSFQITVHEGTLSPAREVLDNLSIGAFQLGYVVSSYHPGKNPLISVLDLPFLPIGTMEQRVEIAEALYDHPAIAEEFARWSTTPVMAVVQPNYEIMGKGTAPDSAEAFDGMRLKATSGIGDALAQFGAVTVSMTGAEQYNGLQTGVIDAVAATPSAHGGWKLYELSEWYTVGMDAGTANVTLVANADAFQSLSDEHKALLQEAEDHAYQATIEAQSEAASTYEPTLAEYKLERIEVPAEMIETLRTEAAKPVWDAFVSETTGQGLPGQEILDFVLSKTGGAG
ncbi:MAG: TRAP transporter substrate-binding protein DctP [Geminicoccaceae bacterium]